MSGFLTYLDESAALLETSREMAPEVERLGEAMVETLRKGGKILAAGNGGSAADAQHFIAELVVRFEKERPGLAGVALTTDTSILTACANDYSFEKVFARQIEALGRPGDLFLGISTSGNSPNIVEAVKAAFASGMTVAVMTGEGGGKLAAMEADHLLATPHKRTALVQQVHEMVFHYLCEMIDREMAG